jgi:hypothetical protein
VREADEAVAGVVAADSVAAAGDSAAAEADSIAELARVLAAAAQTFRAGALRLEVPSVAKGAGVPGRVIETRYPASPDLGKRPVTRDQARRDDRPGTDDQPARGDRPEAGDRPSDADRRDQAKQRLENRQDNRNEYYDDRNEFYDDWRYYGVGTSITVVTFNSLSCTTTSTRVGGVTYYDCGGTWYNRTYSGGTVNYVVVDAPAGH